MKLHKERIPTNLESWHKRNISRIQKENEYKRLLDEQNKLRHKYDKKIKLSTSKIFISLIFVNCTAIEIFAAYITYKAMVLTMTVDLSAVTTLIGAVVGESLSFFIYCYKATRENTRGGITYDAAMKQIDAINNGCENNNNDVNNICM